MKVKILSITKDAEKLIERAGRVAYDSQIKIDASSEEAFTRMIVKRGHESVLEHASATFLISGISRACSHQLVRHRLASYTQRSQRYVDEDGFKFVTPPSVKEAELHATFLTAMEYAKRFYHTLKNMGIPNEDARFVLPNACETEITMTANFREWRHILKLRGAPEAQWEIREMVIAILRFLQAGAPTVFGDLVLDEEKHTITVKK